jgi:hypothetical protein
MSLWYFNPPGQCWLAARLNLDGCEGRIDFAHIGFTEHWLHKAPTGPKLTKKQANDPRILRPVCRHHHHRFDFGRLDLTRSQIPESVEEYAEEFQLTARLDRDYPREGKDAGVRNTRA